MPSKLDDIFKQRRQKLERLRGRGVNTYPNRFDQTHTTQQAIDKLKEYEEKSEEPPEVSTRNLLDGNPLVNIAGRVTARRNMGKIVFMDLRDGSGKIQLLHGDRLDPSLLDLLKDIDIGDFIGVSGRLFYTKTQEPTVAVQEFVILTKSLRPLPEKWHGLSDTEIRYRQRYIDLIANTGVRDIFKTRSRIIAAIRQFLD
ncbi:MAG: hypothetical protein JXA17_01495, partial [Dehalococcoidales bacterium]|nr:hypothetical protein [Dehalococcoidales bacterium]